MNRPTKVKMSKGALIAQSTIHFQFNPETVKHNLTPSTYGGQDARSGPLRFSGAPAETISLEIMVDATEKLDQGDATALASGVLPQLAALELLVYPKLSQVSSNASLMGAGTIEAVPMSAPPTVFVFGSRAAPVRLTSLEVTEQLFDPNLNPIRATVALEMKVVSYSDVFSSDPNYGRFITYQTTLKTLASKS